jgi:hypothetical protein
MSYMLALAFLYNLKATASSVRLAASASNILIRDI